MDDTAAFRALVFDASKGLDSLNTFIESRFALADRMEAEGDLDSAEVARETWTAAWESINGPLRTALAEELHDIMVPSAADDALAFALS